MTDNGELWLDGLLSVILCTEHPPPIKRQTAKHLEHRITHICTKRTNSPCSWRPQIFQNELYSISESCPHSANSWMETVRLSARWWWWKVHWPLTWEHRLPVFPGVTTVLSMTTLMIGSRTSLPNTNCFIKAIDVYLGICFSFVFGALLEYAVAHYSSLQQMAAKDRVRILRALFDSSLVPCAGR